MVQIQSDRVVLEKQGHLDAAQWIVVMCVRTVKRGIVGVNMAATGSALITQQDSRCLTRVPETLSGLWFQPLMSCGCCCE